MRIGIAGFGFVGQAVYASILDPHNVVIYDKYKGIGKQADLLKSDFLFVALPSPTVNGEQKLEEFNDLMDFLVMKDYHGIVIVKSTILFENYPKNKLNIVYNPEFLKQNDAIKDFKNQECIIIGGECNLCVEVSRLFKEKFDLPCLEEIIITTLFEAVNLKYVHNIYHAYKALFWNYIHEKGLNHRKMADLYMKISERRNEMSNICADGKPGFGGACFPKDVIAFMSRDNNEIMRYMIEYNSRLRPEEMIDKL